MIIEGENPVYDLLTKPSGILSSAGHEKSCVKLRGPSRKAKYTQENDSGPVPIGKGEKNPEQGSEIDPEPVCLLAVGASSDVTACLLHNESTSYFLRQG